MADTALRLVDGMGAAPRISQDSVNKLIRIRGQESRRRDVLIPAWQKIAQYFNPALNDWDELNDDMETAPDYRNVYNNVGMKDSTQLADGIQSWGFSRSTPWQRLKTEDPDLMKREDVKLYLQAMELHFYSQLAKSTFYDEGRNMVRICADFGTAVMFRINNRARGIPSYRTLHSKHALIMEDETGEVDTIIRDVWLDASQAVQMFGRSGTVRSALPRPVQTAYERGDTKRFLFYHFAFPVDKFDLDIGARESRGRPYYSVYVYPKEKGNMAITEGGYWYRCWFGWRWSRNPTGIAYGSDCPGLLEVSNVSQLNVMRKDVNRIKQLAARPPIKATDRLRNRINLTPNGITYVKMGEDFQRALATGDIRPMMEDEQVLETSVHDSYHRGLFLVLTENLQRTKTATEVEGIKGEQAAMLTAFFGRMAVEKLEPEVEDLYQLEIDAGRAPVRPRILDGRIVKIDLVSPLALLQKRYLQLDSTRQWLNELLAIKQSELDPNVADFAKIDEYVRSAAELYGVDLRNVRDIVEVERRRKVRAQMQMAQMQAQLEAIRADSRAKAYTAATRAPEPGSLAAPRVA